MATPSGRHPVTLKRVLYELPGMADVAVRTGIPHSSSDAEKTVDLYYPPDRREGESLPAVVFMTGFSDIGARAMLGCRTNEMESYISWARLVAASGLVGVTHTTAVDPAADAHELFASLDRQGAAIGIDTNRVALWACSGHAPNALGVLFDRGHRLKAAVICYGLMLDLDGHTGVAEAQQYWRFANPAAGRTVDDFPADLPLFIARAGHDAIPHVNDSIDRFLLHSLRRNLPVTFVNHHTAPHAFDLDDDSETTRRIVADILSFLRRHLLQKADDQAGLERRV